MKKEIKSIKLNDGKAEFEVFFSAWTAGKMEKAQQFLMGDKENGGYNSLEERIDDMITMFESAPDALKSEDAQRDPATKIIEQYISKEITREVLSSRLLKLMKAQMPLSTKIRNGQILREIVRLMCLESQLTDEQIKLIKSDIDSEFWQNQDAVLLRDTGENFRKNVVEYSS